MKVYILHSHYYEDIQVVSVYLNLQKAEERQKELQLYFPGHISLEEHEVIE